MLSDHLFIKPDFLAVYARFKSPIIPIICAIVITAFEAFSTIFGAQGHGIRSIENAILFSVQKRRILIS